jgi:hypothetical protein
VGLREPELIGPRYAAGRAEEFWSCCYAEGLLGSLEVADEVGIGIKGFPQGLKPNLRRRPCVGAISPHLLKKRREACIPRQRVR